jgi:hypothetical protein
MNCMYLLFRVMDFAKLEVLLKQSEQDLYGEMNG